MSANGNDLTPQRVMAELASIDEQLANLQNAWETAAAEHARLHREWEKRLKLAYLATDKANTVDERKAAALRACLEDDPELYEGLCEAEDGVEKAQTVYKVLDKRASIGQSILRAQREEAFGRQAA